MAAASLGLRRKAKGFNDAKALKRENKEAPHHAKKDDTRDVPDVKIAGG